MASERTGQIFYTFEPHAQSPPGAIYSDRADVMPPNCSLKIMHTILFFLLQLNYLQLITN